MHACIHPCICAYMHTYIYACIHACINVYMHSYIHAYMHTFMHTCTHIQSHTYAYTYVCYIVFIAFTPIHTGQQNASDATLLKDLLQWAKDNPTPSYVTLISGDHYYAKALNSLKSRGFNILLIHPKGVAKILLKSVDNSLNWSYVTLSK